MRKVAIVTDSTSTFPKDVISKYNITVLPQMLIWGEETFKDGVDIQPTEFYSRLQTAKTMPTTSQVSVLTMQQTFEKLVEEGYDVLGVFVSSLLSGTQQSAFQGRDNMSKGKEHVEIVDSRATAMALGFNVLACARAAAEGASLADCKALSEKATAHTGVLFVVDTLEFLHRGGRIGGAQRLLGTALNLKPILGLKDGRVEAFERVRTKGKAMDRLVEIVGEQVGGRTPVRVASLHAKAPEDGKAVLAKVNDLLKPVESFETEVSPVVGTHTGPGTVGIAFMAGM